MATGEKAKAAETKKEQEIYIYEAVSTKVKYDFAWRTNDIKCCGL